MSCCGNVDCGMSCPRALLGWSRALEAEPITFDAYMALSPEDSEASAPPVREEVMVSGLVPA